jgi:hypothetical protein
MIAAPTAEASRFRCLSLPIMTEPFQAHAAIQLLHWTNTILLSYTSISCVGGLQAPPTVKIENICCER